MLEGNSQQRRWRRLLNDDNTTTDALSVTASATRAAITIFTPSKSATKRNRYLNTSANTQIEQDLSYQQQTQQQRRRQLLGFHGGAATLGGALHGGLGSEEVLVARRPVCSISGSPRAGPPLEMVRAYT